MRKHVYTIAAVGFGLSLFFAHPLAAQTAPAAADSLLPEVVVVGTRTELAVEKSGKTIYKISPDYIANNADASVAQLLNEVAGIAMDGAYGTPGTNLEYYLRGGRSRHTLILIDGVPLNDPSGINATYDLRNLPLEQIESIEVLKGGLSTLYGTGAAAGVIDIRLKQPKAGTHGSLDLSAGSFATYEQNLSLSHESKVVSALVSGSRLTSEGFSAALNQDPTVTFDKDGLTRHNLLAKLSLRPFERVEFTFSGAYDEFEADFDADAFLDAENTSASKQYRFGFKPSYQYKKGSLELTMLYNQNAREIGYSWAETPFEYEGRNLQADLVNRQAIGKAFTGVWGLNLQRMSYAAEGVVFNDAAFTILDPYASVIYEGVPGLTVHAGLRLNTHSEYDKQLIYNLNPSYLLSLSEGAQVKLLASLATSYITPSLYQLYSVYGNTALQPESSTNYEAGAALYLQKQLSLEVVAFQRDEEDIIDFVSLFDEEGNYVGGQYQNIAASRTVKGIETSLQWQPTARYQFRGQYTYASSDQAATFYRIPEHKGGASLSANVVDPLHLVLSYTYTGSRTIYAWNAGEQTLEGFGLVDVTANYRLFSNRLKVYGSVRNLLDVEYNSVWGYTAAGRNYSIGLRLGF